MFCRQYSTDSATTRDVSAYHNISDVITLAALIITGIMAAGSAVLVVTWCYRRRQHQNSKLFTVIILSFN